MRTTISELAGEYMRRFTAVPIVGTLAHQLTERDKLALALAAGVPCEFVPGDSKNTIPVQSKVPFTVADRDGGGYVVECQFEPAPAIDHINLTWKP